MSGSLPAPLWCKDRNTHPRCSCTDGCVAADSSNSLHPLPPPPECYQTDWRKKTPKSPVGNILHKTVSFKKRNLRCRTKEENKSDQSLILCSHSIISFTCGDPPEPQSFRALNNTVESENKVLALRWSCSCFSSTM